MYVSPSCDFHQLNYKQVWKTHTYLRNLESIITKKPATLKMSTFWSTCIPEKKTEFISLYFTLWYLFSIIIKSLSILFKVLGLCIWEIHISRKTWFIVSVLSHWWVFPSNKSEEPTQCVVHTLCVGRFPSNKLNTDI